MSDPVIPGTPGINEIRLESTEPEGFEFGPMGSGPSPKARPGIRRVSLRAEIDTTPPFGSVKEAVTRFGGHGPWINPVYKFGDHNYNGEEEFDIKKVEEQTAELEKDLIVKELETLDVLEELTTTKRIVEELKRQLQKESLKCLSSVPQQQQQKQRKNLNNSNFPISPHIKEINRHTPSPPDLILTELKQARLNLGKTINDLGAIQKSVECLTKKMRREKEFIETTREKLNSKLSATDGAPVAEEPDYSEENLEQAIETLKRTAEMRWVAAKKMSEAARAAEALALAEITSLSPQPSEPHRMSFNFRYNLRSSSPTPHNSGWSKKRVGLADAMARIDEAHASKMAMMRKLRDAGEDVKLGRRAVKEALDRVEAAERKQTDVEDAVSRWFVCSPNDRRHIDYREAPVSNKTCTTTSVSMRDVLSKKQVSNCDEGDSNETSNKVALSDMLQALRDDLNFSTTRKVVEKDEIRVGNNNDTHNNKPLLTHRKKFGFIHISLPLTRHNKKKISQQSF